MKVPPTQMGTCKLRLCAIYFGVFLSLNFIGQARGDELGVGLGSQAFDAYSKAGNELIRADCMPESADSTVTCNFSNLRIVAPSPTDDAGELFLTETKYSQSPTPALLAQLEGQLRRLIQKKEGELQREKNEHSSMTGLTKTELTSEVDLTKSYLNEYRQSLAELEKNPSKFAEERKPNWQERSRYVLPLLSARLNDPASGPKTRDLMKRMSSAWSAKDVGSFEELSQSRSSRTCHVYSSSFSIKFKRLSKYKWLSEIKPEGPCKIVRVYELEQDHPQPPLFPGSWTFTQKNIAVGNSMGLCAAFVKGEGEVPVEVFSTKNNHWLELPCDWLDWSLDTLDSSWP